MMHPFRHQRPGQLPRTSGWPGSGAQSSGGQLPGAVFSGRQFSEAVSSGGQFSGAGSSGEQFSEAVSSGGQFSGAVSSRGQFSGAVSSGGQFSQRPSATFKTQAHSAPFSDRTLHFEHHAEAGSFRQGGFGRSNRNVSFEFDGGREETVEHKNDFGQEMSQAVNPSTSSSSNQSRVFSGYKSTTSQTVDDSSYRHFQQTHPQQSQLQPPFQKPNPSQKEETASSRRLQQRQQPSYFRGQLPLQRQPTPLQRQQTPLQRQQTPLQRQQTPLQSQQTPLQRQQTPLQSQQTPLQRQPTPLQSQQTPLQRQPTPLQRQPTPLQRQQMQQMRSTEYDKKESNPADAGPAFFTGLSRGPSFEDKSKSVAPKSLLDLRDEYNEYHNDWRNKEDRASGNSHQSEALYDSYRETESRGQESERFANNRGKDVYSDIYSNVLCAGQEQFKAAYSTQDKSNSEWTMSKVEYLGMEAESYERISRQQSMTSNLATSSQQFYGSDRLDKFSPSQEHGHEVSGEGWQRHKYGQDAWHQEDQRRFPETPHRANPPAEYATQQRRRFQNEPEQWDDMNTPLYQTQSDWPETDYNQEAEFSAKHSISQARQQAMDEVETANNFRDGRDPAVSQRVTVHRYSDTEPWRCCQLCNIFFSSEQHYQSHCLGMLHTQKVAANAAKVKQEADEEEDNSSFRPKGIYGQRQQAKQERDKKKYFIDSPKPRDLDDPKPPPEDEADDSGERLEQSLLEMTSKGNFYAQPLLGVPVSASPAQPSPVARAAMASLAQQLGIDFDVSKDAGQPATALVKDTRGQQQERKKKEDTGRDTTESAEAPKDEEKPAPAAPQKLNCKLCEFLCVGKPIHWDAHCTSFQHRKKYLFAISSMGHSEFRKEYGDISFGDLPLDAKVYEETIKDPFELYILHCGIFGKFECRLCWFKCFSVGAWKEHIYGINHTEKTIQKAKQIGEEKFCKVMCDVPSIYQEKRFHPDKESKFTVPDPKPDQNVKSISVLGKPVVKRNAGIPKTRVQQIPILGQPDIKPETKSDAGPGFQIPTLQSGSTVSVPSSSAGTEMPSVGQDGGTADVSEQVATSIASLTHTVMDMSRTAPVIAPQSLPGLMGTPVVQMQLPGMGTVVGFPVSHLPVSSVQIPSVGASSQAMVMTPTVTPEFLQQQQLLIQEKALQLQKLKETLAVTKETSAEQRCDVQEGRNRSRTRSRSRSRSHRRRSVSSESSEDSTSLDPSPRSRKRRHKHSSRRSSRSPSRRRSPSKRHKSSSKSTRYRSRSRSRSRSSDQSRRRSHDKHRRKYPSNDHDSRRKESGAYKKRDISPHSGRDPGTGRLLTKSDKGPHKRSIESSLYADELKSETKETQLKKQKEDVGNRSYGGSRERTEKKQTSRQENRAQFRRGKLVISHETLEDFQSNVCERPGRLGGEVPVECMDQRGTSPLNQKRNLTAVGQNEGPADQQGRIPIGMQHNVPMSQTNRPLEDWQGNRPVDQQGRFFMGQQLEVPRSQPNRPPGYWQGNRPSDQLGIVPMGQQHEVPRSQPNRPPGDWQGNRPSDQLGRVPMGQQHEVSMSQPNRPPGDWQGKRPLDQQGRVPISQQHEVSMSQPNRPPGDWQGNRPSDQLGIVPIGQQRDVPRSQPNRPPGDWQGNRPSDQHGRVPMGQQRDVPMSQPNRPPGDWQGNRPSGQQGRVPIGQQRDVPMSQPNRPPGDWQGNKPLDQLCKNPMTEQHGEVTSHSNRPPMDRRGSRPSDPSSRKYLDRAHEESMGQHDRGPMGQQGGMKAVQQSDRPSNEERKPMGLLGERPSTTAGLLGTSTTSNSGRIDLFKIIPSKGRKTLLPTPKLFEKPSRQRDQAFEYGDVKLGENHSAKRGAQSAPPLDNQTRTSVSKPSVLSEKLDAVGTDSHSITSRKGSGTKEMDQQQRASSKTVLKDGLSRTVVNKMTTSTTAKDYPAKAKDKKKMSPIGLQIIVKQDSSKLPKENSNADVKEIRTSNSAPPKKDDKDDVKKRKVTVEPVSKKKDSSQPFEDSTMKEQATNRSSNKRTREKSSCGSDDKDYRKYDRYEPRHDTDERLGKQTDKDERLAPSSVDPKSEHYVRGRSGQQPVRTDRHPGRDSSYEKESPVHGRSSKHGHVREYKRSGKEECKERDFGEQRDGDNISKDKDERRVSSPPVLTEAFGQKHGDILNQGVSEEFSSAVDGFVAGMNRRIQHEGGPADDDDGPTPADQAMVEQLKHVTGTTDTALIKKVVNLLSSFNPLIVQELGHVSPLIIQRLIGSHDLFALKLLGDMDPQVIKTLAMMEVPLVLEMADLNGMGFILDILHNMSQADPAVMQVIGDMASEDTSQFQSPQDLINQVLQKTRGGRGLRGRGSFRARGVFRGGFRGNFRGRFFRGFARGFIKGESSGTSRGGFFEGEHRGASRGAFIEGEDCGGSRGGFRGYGRGRGATDSRGSYRGSRGYRGFRGYQ